MSDVPADDDNQPLTEAMVAHLYDCTLPDSNNILNMDDLLVALVRDGCICPRHKVYIESKDGEIERNRRLILVITRRSIKDYKVFVDCLVKQNEPLANLLLKPSQGESYDNVCHLMFPIQNIRHRNIRITFRCC